MSDVDAKVHEIFQLIDKDNSSTIDLTEFQNYAGQINGLVPAGKTAEQVFGEIDTNNDQSLTKEELKVYIQNNKQNFA
jgi:Ca2+-binding EF-hand superfamily protein